MGHYGQYSQYNVPSWRPQLKSVDTAESESDTHGLSHARLTLLHLQTCKTSVDEMQNENF